MNGVPQPSQYIVPPSLQYYVRHPKKFPIVLPPGCRRPRHRSPHPTLFPLALLLLSQPSNAAIVCTFPLDRRAPAPLFNLLHLSADNALAPAKKRGNRPIFIARTLAEAVLFLHLLWCAWIIFGWIITRRRPLLRTLHIASLVYAIIIESVPWPPCPLTVAENFFESRAGIDPARGPFLDHILDAIVYPNLPEGLVVGSAVLLCAAILAIYLRRYLRRSAPGQW